ncbi:unnamed protein product [Arabidopsis halleri]
MAARLLALRRALSLFSNQQHRIPLSQVSTEQLSLSNSLFGRNHVYGRLFQRQLSVIREANEAPVTNVRNSSNSALEMAKVPSLRRPRGNDGEVQVPVKNKPAA